MVVVLAPNLVLAVWCLTVSLLAVAALMQVAVYVINTIIEYLCDELTKK